MSNYYYLVAGLPDLTLEDSKLNYTTADFKTEIYPLLSKADRKQIDLFYLKFDNGNVLKLLKDKDAAIDPRGKYSLEELLDNMHSIKENGVAITKSFPSYLTLFIAGHYDDAPIDDEPGMMENDLAALYYAYGMKSGNRFVAAWFEFNLTMNNIFTAIIARRYKVEMSQFIVGDSEVADALRTSGARDFGLTGEVDYIDRLMKIGEIDELLEREKKTDQLKWEWIEDETFFNYFSVERIFAFLLQTEMIERWLLLDKEKGKELFREIINSLRDDVSIPAEFT